MQLVGVTGYAQHGKDTLGQHLVERYGFTRYGFADALKSMALALNPHILQSWNGDGVIAQRLREVVGTHGWEGAKREGEVRRFLQVLGTEGVRDHIGEESWVNALALRLEQDGCERAVICDVRFPNEAAWVHRMGGVMVRVMRVDPETSLPFDNGLGVGHASEALIDKLPYDVLVANDGTSRYAAAIDTMLGERLAPVGSDITTAYEAALADTPPAKRHYVRLDKLPPEQHLDGVPAADPFARYR